MNQAEIKAYIEQLPYTDIFLSLAVEVQNKIMFGASEMLRRRFGNAALTVELVAIQSVYLAEGEAEEFAKFRRHNVSSMGVEDLRFTFEKGSGDNIAPEVYAIIQAAAAAKAEEAKAEDIPIFGRLF